MTDGGFTISRADFLRAYQLGQVRLDNEHLEASIGDRDAFRFGWSWSWLRLRWVPFDSFVTAPQERARLADEA